MSDQGADEAGMREFLRGFADGARRDTIPKMQGSLFCMMILDGEPDIKLALEIGMALLLDKPLFIVAVGNIWISPRLRQIADAVIEGPAFDESMKERIQAAVGKFMLERGLTQ
jgi:hypothetical protein